MACLTEGIYLIHIREFIITNKNIFKLGRSHNIDTRMGRYPKGSSIIAQLECCNSVQCEKELLVIFKSKFKQNKYYGIEYFEGDKYDMMDVICNEVKKYNKIEKEKLEAVKKIKEIEANNEIDRKKKEEEKVKDITIKKVKIYQEVKEDEKEKEKEKIIVINNRIINKNTDRKCVYCNHQFKYPSYLKNHLKISYHCKTISEQLNTNDAINDSINDTTINILECNKCNKQFKNKKAKTRHLQETKCGKSQIVIINSTINS